MNTMLRVSIIQIKGVKSNLGSDPGEGCSQDLLGSEARALLGHNFIFPQSENIALLTVGLAAKTGVTNSY